ncbi:reverse transcriptase domain-containing protein, partial [Tanacetum coccineum]
PRGRPTRTTRSRPVIATPPPVTDPTTTTSVTSAQLQAMIDEGVTAVLAARATTRNGDDSHTSGTEGVVSLTQWFKRMETVFCISNCTVENQVKFATCTLMGTALTWWNSHARTVTNEVAYAMTWSDLKKKMKTKYCPRNEIKKVKFEWGDKQEATFQLLKQKLCSAPILALPKGSDDFIVYCDASKKGLGAVLMQSSVRSEDLEALSVWYQVYGVH